MSRQKSERGHSALELRAGIEAGLGTRNEPAVDSRCVLFTSSVLLRNTKIL